MGNIFPVSSYKARDIKAVGMRLVEVVDGEESVDQYSMDPPCLAQGPGADGK